MASPRPPPKLVRLPFLLALGVVATLLLAAGLNATLARVRDLRPELHPAIVAAATRDGQTALALRLAKHLAPASGNSTKGNVAFSPVSIHAALSLVAAGARGATLDQLLAFLGAPSAAGLADFGRRIVHRVLGDRAASGGPRVIFSGGIWVDALRGGLKKAFRDVAVNSYKSVARSVSFADQPEKVAEAINSWVKNATNNLIGSIVTAADITADMELVLANAVYFKAKWLHPFHPYHTQPGTFHRLDGSLVDAQFMSQTMYEAQYVSSVDGYKVLKLPYKHGRDAASDADDEAQYVSSVDGFKVLRLPYKHGRDAASDADDDTQYSMYVFLPDERQGMASMVDAITAGPDYLYNVLNKTSSETVTVTLPKFEISFNRDNLHLDLSRLGLSLPFSPESADLGSIFEKDRSTFLSRLLHKSVIKVDEDGTEAAAVTIGLMFGSGMEPPVQFVADHPFSFFIIEERSGVIVFAGHVLDPTN